MTLSIPAHGPDDLYCGHAPDSHAAYCDFDPATGRRDVEPWTWCYGCGGRCDCGGCEVAR